MITRPLQSANLDDSFLYNGTTIERLSKRTQIAKFSYTPSTEHETLLREAEKETDKNVATFSLTFFVRCAGGEHKSVSSYIKPKKFTQSFGRNNCTYDHALARLYEHNAHHRNQDNVVKAMFCPNCKEIYCAQCLEGNPEETQNKHGRKKQASHIQALHHSEQWILIDVRDHIKDYLYIALCKDPQIDKIYGICLNIYSINDPCQWCGETIEKVLPVIKSDIMGFLFAGSAAGSKVRLPKNPGDFKFFATVSSSQRYKAYRDRPAFDSLEKTSHYKDFYNKHSDVKQVAPPFKNLDGKVLYFWTPSTSHTAYNDLLLQFESSADLSPLPYLDISVKQPSAETALQVTSSLNLGYSRLRTLNLSGSNLCISGGYNFSAFHMLSSLILPNTPIATDLTLPSSLRKLDLRGSLLDYKDQDASTKEPWRIRQSLFSSLGRLDFLSELDLTGNKINVDDFRWLIGEESWQLRNIETINVSQNIIFHIKAEAVTEVVRVWQKFVSNRSRLNGIDLTNNGQPAPQFYEFFNQPESKLKLDTANSPLNQIDQSLSIEGLSVSKKNLA